ncbi:aftiphilin isoform X2 [Brachyhypopomus gauderio]|uniref:aftiphilin isoform X2 n=1 Tax=Brachyhypopomus gauderio TaxID=698409 RepID=UPI0040427DCF
MEPDVARLYSSSPPPLDEVGEEEDEDEFGDFGGYGGGVSCSFSFSEIETPAALGPSYAAEISPPDLRASSSQGVSHAGKTTELGEKNQATVPSNSGLSVDEPAVCVDCENGTLKTSDVLVNGDSPSGLQGAQSVLSNTGQHSRDFERSSTDKSGICLGSRHIKLNRDAEEDEPVESGVNSTHTGLPGHHSTGTKLTDNQSTQTRLADEHSTEAALTVANGREPGLAHTGECSDPLSPGSGSISKPGDTVAGEQLPEAISDLQRCNESSVSPTAEVPVVVPNTELLEDPEEVSGAELGSSVEVGPDQRAYEALKEDEGSSVGPTGEEDDDFGDFRDVNQGFADFSRTDSATQEGFADFVTALSGCSSDEEFEDTDTLKDLKEEEELAKEEDGDNDGMQCTDLPPSDSFADFSSAPCGGLAGGVGESWTAFGQQGECESQHETWAAFGQQGECESQHETWSAFGQQGECESQHETWAAFDEEEQSSTTTSPPSDSLQTNNVPAVLSCRLQHLFQSTFLSEVTPEVTEVVTLQVLLEPQDHGGHDCHHAQGESVALWRHLLDIHSAHGLKVQWVGSHSNRILLDSLGMRNILFTQSRRPVIVPIFAAGLGMLEPTKDPVKPSSCSSAALRSSPGRDTSNLCTPVVPSLSITEDAPGGVVSQLNLDFFGPAGEDSDTDSGTDAPLPGLDPELYELTTAKLENSNSGNNRTDAFNRLMESIEKTSTLQRKPERDGEMSEEAAQVISVLPNLSFMRARVLMFPSTLTPTANHL